MLAGENRCHTFSTAFLGTLFGSDVIVHDERRRLFFREALGRMVRPLADFVERRLAMPDDRPRLRPPGAIEEAHFVETCEHCAACVQVCPADAIFLLSEANGLAAGTPAIDPDHAACVVCEGLQCTTVCPSGALLPLVERYDIRMGLAEVYSAMCVRSAGEACTECVDRCPLGEAAIRFDDDGPPTVRAIGCVGCGVCQLYCPTDPKAIVINPL